MRICPECGYQDPPYWRHSKYSYWIDFTEYENFEKIHPELCPLEKGGMVKDDLYVYRRMKKSGAVERKAIIDFEVEGWVPPMEKRDIHDYRRVWNQDKLKQLKLENPFRREARKNESTN